MTTSNQALNEFADQLDQAKAAVRLDNNRTTRKALRSLMDSEAGRAYYLACVESGRPIPERHQPSTRFAQ